MDIGQIIGFWPIRAIIGFAIVSGLLIGGALILVYAERKIIAFIQDRLGPIHNGPAGLLQTLADAMKLLLKEDVIPQHVDKFLYPLAPLIFFMPVAAVYIVMPFATGLQIADLSIGLLYIIAVSTFGSLGVLLAGWGSNNKYSLLGGLRGAAQMVSYELPMVLSLVTIVLMAGSMSMAHIVNVQSTSLPFILIQPLAFLVYFTCALAETNRNPFDLPEAESELVAGYLTEYSGFRWAIFFLGEYGNMAGVSAVATTAFLGGGALPFVNIAGPLGMVISAVVFMAKVYGLIFVMQWIRGTLPRLRADQLMAYCWKVLVPVTLVNIFITSAIVVFLAEYMVPVLIVNWILTIGFVALLPRMLGTTIRPRVQVTSMAEALAGGRV